ncbi:helix-turn-helix transcriptional regulator [Nocardioides dubius]|uniref:HTH cro/C1-type domain-containing protein n=1 Tax=Nocardioides dubius TaxID=317019 RepID=A0ABN1TY89_9ACTN
MDLAERVSTLRRASGLSARELAALVGVAPTTVTRVEAGTVSPSFALAQEILTVLGEPIGFLGGADREAMIAARRALDPALPVAETPGAAQWRERWGRLGLVDAGGHAVEGREADLLERAGQVARLTRRPGAADFDSGPTATLIASLLRSAGIDHALTGDAGANLYRSSGEEAWPVLYVEDVAAAATAAGLVSKASGSYGPRITLIPFDELSEMGRIDIGGISVAARDQVILDAYGGIDRMPEQADILVGRRVA